MNVSLMRCLIAALLAAVFPTTLLAQTGSGAIALAEGGVVENFDTLAPSGPASLLPVGWYFAESGNNANATYSASDGSANGGDSYSLGANGSTERAFGSLLSGSLTPIVGARVDNASAAALSEIDIAYSGEQWRLGTSPRTTPDRLDFQYSVDATSISDATASWVDVAELSFVAPQISGTVGALNGNAAANRVAISGTLTGLNLAPGATVWIRWLDVNVSGADDMLGIDELSINIGGEPPVDVAPTVSSTVPDDQGQNVLLTSSLSVSFSEPVSLDPTWYTLICDALSIAASDSGGPTSYVITPDADLPEAATCTLTVIASAVTDLDGTPDNMLANVVIEFSTLDPSTIPAPLIVSITPADGATQVTIASEVSVSFNESVTVAEGAFALSCDDQPIAATLSGSATLWRLTPDSLLPFSAQCQFSVLASGVSNSFGVAQEQDALSGFSVIEEGQTSAYYSQVNTSSPDQLKCSLHQVIRGHQAFFYSGSGTSTWTILETAQQDPDDANRIIDSYRNRSYLQFADRSGQGSPNPRYNREHTWPNSLGFPGQTDAQGRPNAPYTDTHMLHLTDEGQNGARGNRPLGNCSASCTELPTEVNNGVGGGTGVYPGNSNWVGGANGSGGTFEVWNHRKGDIARAVMYMAIRYEGGAHPETGQIEPDLELTDNRGQIGGSNPAYMGLLSDLLAWHQADLPTEEERTRNDLIQAFQGNRNPFVDHPEWATMALFSVADPAQCVLANPDAIFASGFEPEP